MRPRLKDVVWERVDGNLRIVYDVRDHLLVADSDGTIEALLELLREGTRTPDQVAAEMAGRGHAVSVPDIVAALHQFDAHRLVEDGDRLDRISAAERERHFSNLAYFESFATLDRSREDLRRSLRDCHVLVLGAGGLNSSVIPHLGGLGVGRLTLLDRDVVEPRNFARQYLYRWADIGRRKASLAAQWVRDFDPTLEVDALDAGVDGPEQLGEILESLRPDVVMSGIDQPDEVDSWVNMAAVTHRVPYVRGGTLVTQGVVWSVQPGSSACWHCVLNADDAETMDAELIAERAARRLYEEKVRVNRGIGPAMGLMGALCAFEVLRYLTRFEEPVFAGRPLSVDFAAGCAMRQLTGWTRNPGCSVCGGVFREPAVLVDRAEGR